MDVLHGRSPCLSLAVSNLIWQQESRLARSFFDLFAIAEQKLWSAWSKATLFLAQLFGRMTLRPTVSWPTLAIGTQRSVFDLCESLCGRSGDSGQTRNQCSRGLFCELQTLLAPARDQVARKRKLWLASCRIRVEDSGPGQPHDSWTELASGGLLAVAVVLGCRRKVSTAGGLRRTLAIINHPWRKPLKHRFLQTLPRLVSIPL